jgi:hypothetical protein
MSRSESGQMIRRVSLRVRELAPCLGALVVVLGVAACGSGSGSRSGSGVRSASGPTLTKTAPPALRRVVPRPIVLTAQPDGRLPAPVQDPATAGLGASAVLIGGLDQADVSVSSIVRAGEGEGRTVGSLPSAVHDAAAATLSGHS